MPLPLSQSLIHQDRIEWNYRMDWLLMLCWSLILPTHLCMKIRIKIAMHTSTLHFQQKKRPLWACWIYPLTTTTLNKKGSKRAKYSFIYKSLGSERKHPIPPTCCHYLKRTTSKLSLQTLLPNQKSSLWASTINSLSFCLSITSIHLLCTQKKTSISWYKSALLDSFMPRLENVMRASLFSPTLLTMMVLLRDSSKMKRSWQKTLNLKSISRYPRVVRSTSM